MPSANTVSELVVQVSADTTQAEQGLAAFDSKIKGVGAGLQTAFAGAAVAGIAAVGAAFVVSVKSAADFEKQVSAIAAVSGSSAQELDALRATALQLGKDTSFSASEAATGMEELVKAGVSVNDVIGGAGRAALDLAAAGAVSVADAAEIAANALNVFGLEGADMAHVADQIAGAANASAIGVNDYKFSLAAAGAVAATVGIGFEDLTTAIAAMGNAGIKGSDAGTSLKTMLMNLQPSTKKQNELFRELGIITADGANQFFDATGKAKSFAEIAQVLQDALGGMTEQQKLAALETMFGSDAIRAAAVLAKEGAAGFNELAASIGQVTAQQVAEERLNNLWGSLEKLKGSLETAAIIIGSAFTPLLKELVDALTEAANEAMPAMEAGAKAAAETLAEWGPIIKEVVTFLWENRDAIAAVVAALATFVILTTVIGWITTAIAIVGSLTAAISGAGGVVAALGALVAILGGPVTLAIAAIALAIGAFTYIWVNNWGDIQGKTQAVIEWLSTVPEMIAGFFTAIGQSVTGLQMAVEAGWLAIQTSTTTVWTAITTFLTDWWREILVALVGPIGLVAVLIIDNWELIRTTTETIWAAIKNILIAVWDLIYTEVIQPRLETIKTFIETTWETIKTTISTAIEAVRTVLESTWQAIASSTTEILNAYLTFVRDTIFTPLRTAVETAINAVKTTVEAAWNAISERAHAILDPLLTYVRDTIFEPIKKAVTTVMDAAKSSFTGALDAMKSAVDTVLSSIRSVWETSWSAIQAAAESPEKALKTLIDLVKKLKDVMPEWLIPKSPTPLQIGIEGIMKAVGAMDTAWAGMAQTAATGAASASVASGEIADYIRQAAAARGIDPSVAIRIAQHEGGVDEPAKRGTFATGSSWWPFQLHYGGKGYEYLGGTAGMGNTFTAATGFAPGDPRAWKASVDYALDHARKHGWGAWYGRGPAGVGAWQGIPGRAAGGWAGLHGPELAWLGERGPEYVVPNSALRGSGASMQMVMVDVAIGGRVAEQIVVEGRDLAIRRGRVEGAGRLSRGALA